MGISLTGFIKGLLLQDESDRSKQLAITVSPSATTGTTTTLVASQTANQTLTLPDSSGTLVTSEGPSFTSALTLEQTATPSNPAPGFDKLYFKSNDELFILNSAGVETAVSGFLTNPMTTLGDTLYGNTGGAVTRLAGDTSNTRKFLREQSIAGSPQAPAWDVIQVGDVPTLNQNTTGTAANITASSNSTLTSLPNLTTAASLSLPGSQVTGNISGNAANVTGTVAIAHGGTGQTTQSAAINALLPAQSANNVLTSDGTNVSFNLLTNSNLNGSAGITGSNIASGTITGSNLQSSINLPGTPTVTGSNFPVLVSTTTPTYRTVSGYVDTSGTSTGQGFTVVKNSTGIFTVTFSPAFSSAPVVVGNGVVNPAVPVWVIIQSKTTTTAVIFTLQASGGVTNVPWDFIAIGPV